MKLYDPEFMAIDNVFFEDRFYMLVSSPLKGWQRSRGTLIVANKKCDTSQ